MSKTDSQTKKYTRAVRRRNSNRAASGQRFGCRVCFQVPEAVARLSLLNAKLNLLFLNNTAEDAVKRLTPTTTSVTQTPTALLRPDGAWPMLLLRSHHLQKAA